MLEFEMPLLAPPSPDTVQLQFILGGLYCKLSISELKALALTSHYLSASVRQYMLSNVTFTIRNEKQVQDMKWYPPASIKRLYWISSMHHNRDMLFQHFPSASHFTLSDNYGDPIGPIPLRMQQMNFGKVFNHPLPPLPPQITHLIFGPYFNSEIHELPSGLTHLVLGLFFCKSLPPLPQSIIHLTLKCGYVIHKPLATTPLPHLRYLNVMETSLDQPITDTLYPQLIHLMVGYNSSLELVDLPSSLKYLHFSWCRHSLDGQLPEHLTHLIFSLHSRFNHPLTNLPCSLTHLVLPLGFNEHIDPPTSLTHLHCDDTFNKAIKLPPLLTHLVLGTLFRQPITLPNGLTHLTIKGFFIFDTADLPLTLTHLSVSEFHHSFHSLPHSLIYLAVTTVAVDSGNFQVPLPSHFRYLSLPNPPSQAISHSDSVQVVHSFSVLAHEFWDPRPPE